MVEDTTRYPGGPTHAVDRSATGIVPRGMAAGTLAGLVTGAAAGTLVLPVIGSVIGLAVGCVIGLLLGSVDSLVLVVFSGLLTTRPRAAAGSAVVAALSGVVLMAFCGLGAPVELAFVIACGVVGALIGPRVMLGKRAR